MEKSKNRGDEKAKERMMIRVGGGGGGGGGVGGVIVLGGALAIAALVSVSAIKFRRQRESRNKSQPPPPPIPIPIPITGTDDVSNKLELNNNNNTTTDKDEAIKGLPALLQPSSPTTTLSQSHLMDEKLVIDRGSKIEKFTNGEQEILLPEKSLPESDHVFTNSEVKEEELSPAVSEVRSLLRHDNLSKNEGMEDTLTVEAIEVMKEKEEKAIIESADHADPTEEEEDNPQIQLVGGEEEPGKTCDDKEITAVEQIGIGDNAKMELVEENRDYSKDNSAETEIAQANQIAVEEGRQIKMIEGEENDEEEKELEDKENTGGRSCEMAEEEDGDHESTFEMGEEAEQVAVEDNSNFELVKADGEEKENYDQEDTVEKGEVAVETAQVDRVAVEENLKLQLVEAEQEEKENAAENGEDEVEMASIAVQEKPLMKSVEGEEEYDRENTAEEVEEANETAQAATIERDTQMKLVEEEYTEKEIIAEKVEDAGETAQVDQVADEDIPQIKLVKDGGHDGKDILENDKETVRGEDIIIKDHPQMQFSEEEEEEEEEEGDDDDDSAQDDSNEDDIVDVDEDNEEDGEICEEGSEGTGDSSMASNAEAIWPAESFQEFPLDFKESNINNRDIAEKIEEDDRVLETGEKIEKEDRELKADEFGYNGKSIKATIERNFSGLLKPVNQAMNSTNMRIWIWSLLTALMVILLVLPMLLSLAQIVKLGLIVFIGVVLSKFPKSEKLS